MTAPPLKPPRSWARRTRNAVAKHGTYGIRSVVRARSRDWPRERDRAPLRPPTRFSAGRARGGAAAAASPGGPGQRGCPRDSPRGGKCAAARTRLGAGSRAGCAGSLSAGRREHIPIIPSAAERVGGPPSSSAAGERIPRPRPGRGGPAGLTATHGRGRAPGSPVGDAAAQRSRGARRRRDSSGPWGGPGRAARDPFAGPGPLSAMLKCRSAGRPGPAVARQLGGVSQTGEAASECAGPVSRPPSAGAELPPVTCTLCIEVFSPRVDPGVQGCSLPLPLRRLRSCCHDWDG